MRDQVARENIPPLTGAGADTANAQPGLPPVVAGL